MLLAYIWDRKNCPLYGVAGCMLFRGCLSIEVNGRAVRIVHYIVGVRYSGVSIKRGSTVFLCITYHEPTQVPECSFVVFIIYMSIIMYNHIIVHSMTARCSIQCLNTTNTNNYEVYPRFLRSVSKVSVAVL